jgi:hypothetical protein
VSRGLWVASSARESRHHRTIINTTVTVAVTVTVTVTHHPSPIAHHPSLITRTLP